MKKLLSCLVVLGAFVFGLAGCSGTPTSAPKPSTETPKSEPKTDKPKGTEGTK